MTRLSMFLAGCMTVLLSWPVIAHQVPDPPVVQTDILPEQAPGEPEAQDPGLDRADLEAWLDGYFPYALQAGDIAGAVVVVVEDGQVLLQKGYGYADLEQREPVDPERHLFRPGSVSKLFTWTAVMQLVEQGKLDLDADIAQYIDFSIPERDGKPVTLRQIMTHTAGFEEQIRGLISGDAQSLVPLDESLKRWVPERIHSPGTTPAYSNYATALAGYIVQRVSGEPFDDYIDAHIFQPLGMRHSSFRQPLEPALLADMSKGYQSASDGEAQDYELISQGPAGSLAATGADMARFMIAHLQNGAYGDARILDEDTAVQMHTTAQASVGPLNKMMLGFYETSMNGHRAISHGGDTRWFHSNLQLFLDEGIGIFVSLNSTGRGGASAAIRDALSEGFVARYLSGPSMPESTVSEADAKLHAQQITGSYGSSRRADSSFMSLLGLLGSTRVYANEDGTISVSMAVDASGTPKKWREISPYVWQDVASGNRLAADVVDGRVTRFSLEPYAAIMVFPRLSGLRDPALMTPLLVVALLVLALTVVAWPVSAVVRRYYGAPYRLSGTDARWHRILRIVALAVLVAFTAVLVLVVWMMGDFERLGASTDGLINFIRLLNTLVLPLGALAALWGAWQVLRSGRRWLAKLWAVLIALSCVLLLYLGLAYNVLGYGAYY